MTTPTGEATGSSSAVRAWYFFSEAVPETEIIVPIVTPSGIAFAVRPGAMPEQTLDRLNEAADHLLSVGLAAIRLPRQTPPPEP